MKKFTSLVFALFACVGMANAQTSLDWDENGQFKFYPEDLVCEGGVKYDEDEGAFVFDGTPGKISIAIPEGQTFDWSNVKSIEVKGSLEDENGESHELTYYAWNSIDPLATFTLRGADMVNSDGENIINTWMGSRYSIDLSKVGDKEYHNGKKYAEMSSKIVEASWGTRNTENEEDGTVTAVAGMIYIDEIVFTKNVEKDPKAISDEMFYEWDNWDATAQKVSLAGCDYNLEKALGTGSVIYGTGSVLGKQFADLTEYAGIYAKGTPGVTLRLLFNRPDMEGGSAPISECNPTFDENGEFYFYFTDLAEVEINKNGEAYPYVHLNAVKLPWGLPEGVESAKVLKFNYIEKGETGVNAITTNLVRSTAIYNLAGQKVSANYKGIVVKNGKKLLNK